jgi:hypothetical protein
MDRLTEAMEAEQKFDSVEKEKKKRDGFGIQWKHILFFIFFF